MQAVITTSPSISTFARGDQKYSVTQCVTTTVVDGTMTVTPTLLNVTTEHAAPVASSGSEQTVKPKWNSIKGRKTIEVLLDTYKDDPLRLLLEIDNYVTKYELTLFETNVLIEELTLIMTVAINSCAARGIPKDYLDRAIVQNTVRVAAEHDKQHALDFCVGVIIAEGSASLTGACKIKEYANKHNIPTTMIKDIVKQAIAIAKANNKKLWSNKTPTPVAPAYDVNEALNAMMLLSSGSTDSVTKRSNIVSYAKARGIPDKDVDALLYTASEQYEKIYACVSESKSTDRANIEGNIPVTVAPVSMIKKMSGNDTMCARKIYQSSVALVPIANQHTAQGGVESPYEFDNAFDLKQYIGVGDTIRMPTVVKPAVVKPAVVKALRVRPVRVKKAPVIKKKWTKRSKDSDAVLVIVIKQYIKTGESHYLSTIKAIVGEEMLMMRWVTKDGSYKSMFLNENTYSMLLLLTTEPLETRAAEYTRDWVTSIVGDVQFLTLV